MPVDRSARGTQLVHYMYYDLKKQQIVALILKDIKKRVTYNYMEAEDDIFIFYLKGVDYVETRRFLLEFTIFCCW